VAISVLLFVCVFIQSWYVPASATDTDILYHWYSQSYHGGYVGSIQAGASCFLQNGSGQTAPDTADSRSCISDGDETTDWFPDGSYQCTGTCYYAVGYHLNAASTIAITQVEVTFKYAHSGTWTVRCGVLSNPAHWESDGTAMTAGLSYPSAGTSTRHDLSSACDLGTNNLWIVNSGNMGSGTAWGIHSFRGYGTTATSVQDYCYNMSVQHPSFSWVATCSFRIGWHGTLAIGTNPAGTFVTNIPGDSGVDHNPSVSYNLTTGYGPGTEGPLEFEIVQYCFPLCQSDEFDVTITDTDRGLVASFIFFRSSDGSVGDPPVYSARFVSWAACYNLAANDCDAEFDPSHAHSSGAGTVDTAYTWTCAAVDVAIGCSGTTATFTEGQQSRTNASIISTVRATHTDQSAGTYNDWGLTASTTGSTTWMMILDNPVTHEVVTMSLNFTTGGTVGGSKPPPGGGTVVCGDLDVLCGLRQIFAVAKEDVLIAVGNGVGSLRTAMLSKQPFNFMVRASDGIGTQLAAASAAVSATDSCPGLHITVPFASWAPSTMFPGAPDIDFYMLKCSDFETVVGTDWYQSIRSAMDPALYLLFAWKQVQRFRPKPTMNG
jgi:hypothetical protein